MLQLVETWTVLLGKITMTYSDKLYLLLGANGLIGKELKKYILLNTTDKSLFVSNSLDASEIIEKIRASHINYFEIIVINATNAFGDKLTELSSQLSCLRKKCKQIQFWHISTQAVSNGSDYGEIKSQDEKFLTDEYESNLKIFRLGVPVITISNFIKGIGYWDKVEINMNSRRKLLIQINSIDLHYCEHLFLGLAEQKNITVKIPTMRIFMPKKMARLIPYRKLNSILNKVNIGLIG